eukprot:148738-Hanusia_phi.AAC.4
MAEGGVDDVWGPAREDHVADEGEVVALNAPHERDFHPPRVDRHLHDRLGLGHRNPHHTSLGKLCGAPAAIQPSTRVLSSAFRLTVLCYLALYPAVW